MRNWPSGHHIFFSALFYVLIFTFVSCCVKNAFGSRVNCRKYVHHPLCRGIAAKRDLNHHGGYLQNDDADYWMDPVKIRNANNNFIKLKKVLDELEDPFKKNLNDMESTITEQLQIGI